MIVNVTVLGSDKSIERTAADVVGYLEGKLTARAGQRGPVHPPLDVGAAEIGVVGYYADSVEGAGRWFGHGVGSLQRTGTVDPAELDAVLRGVDPVTGETLVGAQGSAARAGRQRSGAVEVPADGPLSTTQAAAVLGVDPSYVRKLAEHHNPTGHTPTRTERASLAGTKVAGEWRFERADIDAFAAQRTPPAAVVGYDVTFSVPKSVSVLWALSDDPAVRGEVIAAVDAAVTAGMDYLQERAAWVNIARTPTVAGGLLAASYLHATNRNLEPQLHAHVVVANMTEGPDGKIRALDARGLFLHARTASHLAAAQLRHELTRRLGVGWEPVERGLADIAGINDEAMRAFSTRAADIDAATAALGWDSSAARQVAAFETRPAKQHRVDPDRLRDRWAQQAATVGLSAELLRADVLNRVPHAPQRVMLAAIHDWFARLQGPDGVTQHSATFDRRDVIARVADLAGNRLPAEHVLAVADAFLASTDVLALDPAPGERQSIRRRDGAVVPTRSGDRLHATAHMRNLEQWIVDRYEAGLATSSGAVPAQVIDRVVGGASDVEFGPDQAAMVRAVCSSGDRIQCVLGPAGPARRSRWPPPPARGRPPATPSPGRP